VKMKDANCMIDRVAYIFKEKERIAERYRPSWIDSPDLELLLLVCVAGLLVRGDRLLFLRKRIVVEKEEADGFGKRNTDPKKKITLTFRCRIALLFVLSRGAPWRGG
jgi:hypothetical protein